MLCRTSVLLPLCGLLVLSTPLRAQSVDDNWHQWRGPEATGVSSTATPPTEWSEDKNVRWKVPIEGQGSSVPIIWGDKVFVLTAINTGKVDPSLPKPEDQPKRIFGIKHPNTSFQFVVLCLDRATGKDYGVRSRPKKFRTKAIMPTMTSRLGHPRPTASDFTAGSDPQDCSATIWMDRNCGNENSAR